MLTLSDLDCVALTIWGEARGVPIEGKIAVGNVIRNRYLAKRWGEHYPVIVFRRWQFSCWTPQAGQANYEALKALSDQVRQGNLPADVVLKECYWIAQGLLGGQCQDNVQRATHYFVSGTTPPKWSHGHLPVAVIGRHRFYARIRLRCV